MNTICTGLEGSWFSPDVAYKIYAWDGNVVGVKVGGQFHDKTSVRAQLFPFYLTIIGIPIIESLAAWADKRRKKAEDLAERDFACAQKLKTSMTIPVSDISCVELCKRRHWWTVGFNSGTITLHRRSGPKWKLIAIGRQDIDQVVAKFESLGIAIKQAA